MNRNIDFIPFSRPCLGQEEEEAILQVLRSGWLTTGKETEAFEQEFGKHIGTSHARALNSGTAGLHLALEACGIGPEDKVITTPFTFTATAEVLHYLGAHPLFVDICPDTLNIDPNEVERVLDKSSTSAENRLIKGIIPVHLAGHPCDMNSLMDIKQTYGLCMVEDAAHAFPAIYQGRQVGTFGEAGVFSFYATKTITTGEGGMLVTDNAEIAKRVTIMRLHGIDRDIWNRYTHKQGAWKYDILDAGYKYNMTDLSAALGRVQLKKATSFAKKRRKIAFAYNKAFKEFDFLSIPPDSKGHSHHLYIIKLNLDKLTINRDDFIYHLRSKGIGASVHFIPLHLMSFYKKRYGYNPYDFPQAYKAFQCCISLPLYPDLTEEQIEIVIHEVCAIGGKYYNPL